MPLFVFIFFGFCFGQAIGLSKRCLYEFMGISLVNISKIMISRFIEI